MGIWAVDTFIKRCYAPRWHEEALGQDPISGVALRKKPGRGLPIPDEVLPREKDLMMAMAATGWRPPPGRPPRTIQVRPRKAKPPERCCYVYEDGRHCGRWPRKGYLMCQGHDPYRLTPKEDLGVAS
jgi:hypothetical protein